MDLVVDTGGLLRALARRHDGTPSWPDYEASLRAARLLVVPAPVLVETDYFLRQDRPAMRKLIAEIFDPETTYEYDPGSPADIVRAMQIDAKFRDLGLGLTDGVVAAVAERRRINRVLTTNRAHFSTLRIGPRFRRALTLVP